MMTHTRTETWLLPNGNRAEVEIEVHDDGSEIVPLAYGLFVQMAGDLNFVRQAPQIPTPTVVGNYLDPAGLPVNATRAPDPTDHNVIGGHASAAAWCVRWIKAAADVEVFRDSRDAFMWDHNRTRHILLPGHWVVWTGTTFRTVDPDAFRAYASVTYPLDSEIYGEREK